MSRFVEIGLVCLGVGLAIGMFAGVKITKKISMSLDDCLITRQQVEENMKQKNIPYPVEVCLKINK